MTDLNRLLAYDRWANGRVRDGLRTAHAEGSRAVEIFAHIAAVHELFLARIRGESGVVVWPKWSLDEVSQSLDRSFDQWRSELDHRDPEETIRYTNSKGENWSSSIGEIIIHVVVHGSYHRGQIANLIANAGSAPPYTDFIEAARRREV